jgi:nitrate/nitrite-specific signal transduction histidine kinase
MGPIFTRSRLRRRILAWSFFPTAIILFAVALVAVYAYGRVTEQEAVQRNQELARLSATNLAAEINQFALDLGGLTRQTNIASGEPDDQNAALAASSNNLAVFDAGTIILDAHGMFAAAWPARPGDSGHDWSSRPFFAQLLRSARPVYSDIALDGPEGTPVIVVAVAITGPQGEFNGVLAGMFRVGATSVSALYGDIVKLRVGVSGDVYLVDGNARVIQHPDTSLIGTSLASEKVVQDVVAGQAGAVRTRDLNNRDVVAGYAPVPGTSWGLIAVESWSMLIGPFQEYRTLLLVLLVLGLLIPSLVVLLGVRRVTRPVLALTQAAREVAGGNFEHPVTIKTRDELQELAEQFNEMSRQLRDSYGELDRRVAARTQELATLNAVASVVSQSLDLERILHDALAKIMEDLGFDAGAAFVLPDYQDGPQRLTVVAAKDISAQGLSALSSRGEGDMAHWLEDADPRPVSLHVDETVSPELRRLALEGFASLVEIPVSAKGKLFGVLMLVSAGSHDLSSEQLAPLAAVGNQIGMAVDNARLFEKAEESAATAERDRLARDLHDAVSQTLFSVSLIAEVLPRIFERDPAQAKDRLEELRQLTRGALAEMRTLLLELRPAALAEANLADLLKQLAEAVTGRARIPVELRIESCGKLPTEVRVALYRISQEALNNVVKHSGATRAALSFTCEGDEIRLVIGDNGSGFDAVKAGAGQLGLGIMMERAEAVGATLELDSKPGLGTTVCVGWQPRRVAG